MIDDEIDETNDDDDLDLIKGEIYAQDFEDDPPDLEQIMFWQAEDIHITSLLLVAIAEKLGVNTKELLGELHPGFEIEDD